jgi:hypothetical protein
VETLPPMDQLKPIAVVAAYPNGVTIMPEACPDLAGVCAALQSLRRQCVFLIRVRVMQENCLRAWVATGLGYSSADAEADRKKKFQEADAAIKRLRATPAGTADAEIVKTASLGTDALLVHQGKLEKCMEALARGLPVAAWVEAPEQRGFGLLSLAVVVGEAGDLSGYPAPGKLWKRMGCAPVTARGLTRMGSTWRSGREGKLSAAEWEAAGYSPRRRSVSYLFGENLLRGNFVSGGGAGEKSTETDAPVAGPYRARYLEARARAEETRPEWGTCPRCAGSGRLAGGKKCGNCKGTGRVAMRYHRHGMLLATKLLLKNLWIEWNRGGAARDEVKPIGAMPPRRTSPNTAGVAIDPVKPIRPLPAGRRKVTGKTVDQLKPIEPVSPGHDQPRPPKKRRAA